MKKMLSMNTAAPLGAASQRTVRGVAWVVFALIGVLAALGGAATVEQARRHGGIGWTAAAGDTVAVPGGTISVTAVIPETIGPMNHSGYAQLGMSMQTMVPDSTPEGQRTFTVLVSLAGTGAAGLDAGAERFTVSGHGLAAVEPLRAELGDALVPPGSGKTGVLVFRVPAELEAVTLRYDGGHPITLQLGEAPEHH